MPHLTQEQIRDLKRLAKIGFAYSAMIQAMPEEIKKEVAKYYGTKQTKHFHIGPYNFSSILLAYARGFSPKERSDYLAAKRAKKNG